MTLATEAPLECSPICWWRSWRCPWQRRSRQLASFVCLERFWPIHHNPADFNQNRNDALSHHGNAEVIMKYNNLLPNTVESPYNTMQFIPADWANASHRALTAPWNEVLRCLVKNGSISYVPRITSGRKRWGASIQGSGCSAQCYREREKKKLSLQPTPLLPTATLNVTSATWLSVQHWFGPNALPGRGPRRRGLCNWGHPERCRRKNWLGCTGNQHLARCGSGRSSQF